MRGKFFNLAMSKRVSRWEGEAPAEPGFARDLSGSAGASPSQLGIS
jgi:hypothetical protein